MQSVALHQAESELRRFIHRLAPSDGPGSGGVTVAKTYFVLIVMEANVERSKIETIVLQSQMCQVVKCAGLG